VQSSCPNCGGKSPDYQPRGPAPCLDEYHYPRLRTGHHVVDPAMPQWAVNLYYGLRRWEGGLEEGVNYIMRHVRPVA